MRARACIKCKKYVLISPNNLISQLIVKSFEKKHMRHNLVTLDLKEVLKLYRRSDEKEENDVPELLV